jgi:hypothetical protein
MKLNAGEAALPVEASQPAAHPTLNEFSPIMVVYGLAITRVPREFTTHQASLGNPHRSVRNRQQSHVLYEENARRKLRNESRCWPVATRTLSRVPKEVVEVEHDKVTPRISTGSCARQP